MKRRAAMSVEHAHGEIAGRAIVEL